MIASCSLRSSFERSSAEVLRQLWKAASAASMARRVSALPDFGTVPIFRPVAGLVTSIVGAGIGLHPFAVDEIGLAHEMAGFLEHCLVSFRRLCTDGCHALRHAEQASRPLALRCPATLLASLILHPARPDQSRATEARRQNRRDSLSRTPPARPTARKRCVTTAQAVAIVIWLEASAWPVPNCTAIR